MRLIPLTQGQFAVVSDEDFEGLSRWKWCAWRNPHTQSFYAVRRDVAVEGKQRTTLMHRQILNLGYGDKRQGDHGNGNTLDNRRLNLRIATHAENTRNRGKHSNNSSGFKGVWQVRGKWRAQIMADRKLKHLGYFATAELAHSAYRAEAERLHGDFARVA